MRGDIFCVEMWETESTSTFARYAVGGSAIEDHPPKERAIGDVLFGPGRSQSSTPTALLPAHARHVEHLAPPVLPLLQPAVASCKQKRKALQSYSTSETADPDALHTRAACIISDEPTLLSSPFTLPTVFCLILCEAVLSLASRLPCSQWMTVLTIQRPTQRENLCEFCLFIFPASALSLCIVECLDSVE